MAPANLDGPDGDYYWLMRAAACMEAGPSLPRHAETVQHLATTQGTYFLEIARYLVGLREESQILKLARLDEAARRDLLLRRPEGGARRAGCATPADWYLMSVESGAINKRRAALGALPSPALGRTRPQPRRDREGPPGGLSGQATFTRRRVCAGIRASGVSTPWRLSGSAAATSSAPRTAPCSPEANRSRARTRGLPRSLRESPHAGRQPRAARTARPRSPARSARRARRRAAPGGDRPAPGRATAPECARAPACGGTPRRSGASSWRLTNSTSSSRRSRHRWPGLAFRRCGTATSVPPA